MIRCMISEIVRCEKMMCLRIDETKYIKTGKDPNPEIMYSCAFIV